MDEPIAVDERGNALLTFDFGEEADLDSLEDACPVRSPWFWSGTKTAA